MFWNTKSRQLIRRRLAAWYRVNARDLPWRRRTDAYAIWLSEVMLQQTQVETVKAYFERFVAEFPDVGALAQADEDRVLRLWEGLGYYRRARQLHRAAKVVVEKHGGVFPSEPEAVLRLPGIGRYTAGAILSIAFDARQPILEANTVRLFSRLLGFDGDPHSNEGQRILWAAAEEILPRRNVGRLNQALMELGGQVCAIRGPRCEQCPLATECRANQECRQEEIPRPKAKRPIEAVREAAVVVFHRGRVLLLRRPEGGRWAGLWDFPRFAIDGERSVELPSRLEQCVREVSGEEVVLGEHFATFSHCVTRFRIRLDCYTAKRRPMPSKGLSGVEAVWVRPGELQGHPLSSTGRKIADHIFTKLPLLR